MKNNPPSSEFEHKDKCPSCGSPCNIHTDLDDNDECNECRNQIDGLEMGQIIPKEEPKQGTIKQSVVEWQHDELMRINFEYATQKITPRDFQEQTKKTLEQAKEMEEERRGCNEVDMLNIIQKFGFDYTYNYRGEKTIYEWIPEWFEEYKRLNKQFKKKIRL